MQTRCIDALLLICMKILFWNSAFYATSVNKIYTIVLLFFKENQRPLDSRLKIFSQMMETFIFAYNYDINKDIHQTVSGTEYF